MPKPIRLRDFIEDADGWLYAVSTYDNRERVGCVLRYVPDPQGERTDLSGRRYRKLDFEEAYEQVRRERPWSTEAVTRVPLEDVRRVLKPETEIAAICTRNERVNTLVEMFDLPAGTIGCTGSFLCGLEVESSDIDLVVYGTTWFEAQERLQSLIREGQIRDLSLPMWWKVYEKRTPAINFETFLCHEKRKWNRGEIGGTYFDLLFTRSYGHLEDVRVDQGERIGRRRIRAHVTDASLAFDSPAIYEVDHESVSRVLSFTHTYSGQARKGEVLEAQGMCERHEDELWLVVGTSRAAPDEYIISLSLMGG